MHFNHGQLDIKKLLNEGPQIKPMRIFTFLKEAGYCNDIKLEKNCSNPFNVRMEEYLMKTESVIMQP